MTVQQKRAPGLYVRRSRKSCGAGLPLPRVAPQNAIPGHGCGSRDPARREQPAFESVLVAEYRFSSMTGRYSQFDRVCRTRHHRASPASSTAKKPLVRNYTKMGLRAA